MNSKSVIGFIGGGNLARAIAGGILKKGVIESSRIIVSAPSEETLNYWKTLSVCTTHSNTEVINDANIIILAIKPHQLDTAISDIKPELLKEMSDVKLLISLLAGTPSEVIYTKFKLLYKESPNCGCNSLRLIRVMPNTLALIGEGCTAIAAHSSATPKDIEIAKAIFSTLGRCEIVGEYLISAVTGLSGSGPAYVYMIIEALSDGGVKQGLPRNLATTFAAQTVLGAAKMVLETNKHPSQLKDEVCSAGGTTIHAVHTLEKGGLRATLMSAVEAATKRADKMSSKQIICCSSLNKVEDKQCKK